MMTVVDSIILGIVEGVTEYLPVSSTGHLLVTQHFLGIPDDNASNAFAVCLQGEAILAVLGLYYKYVKSMVMGVFGKDPKGLKLFINMMLAFIPAVAIGLAFDNLIKKYLFQMWPIALSWFVGGIGILIYSRYRSRTGVGNSGKTIDELTPAQAVGIGLMQCVAMWPGTSRSLMTMIGGMVMGLSIVAAVEFSFLLGLVTLGAATCYDAWKHGAEMMEKFELSTMLIGTFFAWISAVIAIKWMITYLQKHSFSIFGWYRIAIGIALALWIYYTPLQ